MDESSQFEEMAASAERFQAEWVAIDRAWLEGSLATMTMELLTRAKEADGRNAAA